MPACSRARRSFSTPSANLDRVVACTRYCADVVPAVADGSRTILADSWTADTAQIVAAQPDLVIAAVPYQEKAVSEILKAGARFLGLAPKTLADIYTDIATIAGVVGATDRGEGSHRGDAEPHRREFAPARRQRTAQSLLRGVGQAIDRVADNGWRNWSRPQEAISWALPGGRSHPRRLRALDPEVIIAAWCGAGDRVPLEKIIRDRGWQADCGRASTAASSAFATNFSTRPRLRFCKVWTRWPSRFIPNSSPTRKESGGLLTFRLPQCRIRCRELRFHSMPVASKIEEVRNDVSELAQSLHYRQRPHAEDGEAAARARAEI